AMTETDWLACRSPSFLSDELIACSNRKLHLLTAAFLRRVWDLLPCEHDRLAVEATEKFADGRITADELARLRSHATLEAGEPLWLGTEGGFDYGLIGMGCECCMDSPFAVRYAREVEANGH